MCKKRDAEGIRLEFAYLSDVYSAGEAEAEMIRWRKGWIKWLDEYLRRLAVKELSEMAVNLHYNKQNGSAPVKPMIGEK
jgi:hypothetical protein